MERRGKERERKGRSKQGVEGGEGAEVWVGEMGPGGVPLEVVGRGCEGGVAREVGHWGGGSMGRGGEV